MASTTRFFYKHAGYSYDPQTETKTQGRWRGARELARAEAHAQRMEWTYEWQYDDIPWEGGGPAPDEVLGCVMRDTSGSVLASLWGIGDPSREYRRVIEAGLALEAMDEIQQAVYAAI